MKRKHTKLIWLSAALCILCVAAMACALYYTSQPQIRFIPPDFDPTAVAGVPDLTPEDGYSALDTGVYSFSISGILDLKDGKTDLWLTNHAENENVWIKVVVKDKNDNELGETGLVRPGEYVQSVQFKNPPTKNTDVKLVVMGYEPETYYSVGNVTLYTSLYVPES